MERCSTIFRSQWIGRYLTEPPRQPEYRQQRPHAAFVTNLPAARAPLMEAVDRSLERRRGREYWPEERVAELVAQKYGQAQWNLRH